MKQYNVDEIIEIKDKLMLDALKNNKACALDLAFIDRLYILKLNDNIEPFSGTDKLSESMKYVFGQELLISPETMIKFAQNTPTQTYAYIGLEKDINIGNLYAVIDQKIEHKLNNIIPILLTTDITPSDYMPIWISKDPGKSIPPVYTRNYIFIGEGWGDLQGKIEALTKKVDKNLYNTWKANIREIEEKKLQDFNNFTKNYNENKKQEIA